MIRIEREKAVESQDLWNIESLQAKARSGMKVGGNICLDQVRCLENHRQAKGRSAFLAKLKKPKASLATGEVKVHDLRPS